MKTIFFDRYGSPDVLQLREVDKPEPRAGEMLVRMHAASVNPADSYMMRGRPYPVRSKTGWARPKVGGLGLDYAGVVEAVGEDVADFRPGDEVFGEVPDALDSAAHSFAEYLCVAASSAVHKPTSVSFAEAAAVPLAGCTALYALRDYAQVQQGEHVLINGAGGGVGSHAVQLAKQFGATVTAVCSEGKRRQMMAIGADRVIDYQRCDFTSERISYDVIIDVVSSQSVRRCRRVLAPEGRFVWIGAPDTNGLFGPLVPAAKVLMMSVASRRQKWLCQSKPSTAADLAQLAQSLADGTLRPVIDRRYPLERVACAIRHVEQGHACGKVVIEF